MAPCHSGAVVAPSVIVLPCLRVPATLPHCQLATLRIWPLLRYAGETRYLALDQTTPFPCKDLSIHCFPARTRLTTDHLVLHASHFTDHVARAAPVPVSRYNPHKFSPLLLHIRGSIDGSYKYARFEASSLYCRNRETRLIRAHETIQGLLSVAVVSWTAGPRQQRECSHGVKLEVVLQTIHR